MSYGFIISARRFGQASGLLRVLKLHFLELNLLAKYFKLG